MFAFRLAERLGRTVGELEATMSNAEFVRWVGLAQHDELMAERERMRGAAGATR